MNGTDIKETMEQVHMPEEMQEQILLNIHNRMKDGKVKTGYRGTCISWRKRAAVAAAFILVAGLVGIPVQALVQNMVKSRMESIPREEVQGMEDLVRGQNVEADSFSREYSDKEKERMKELGKAYRKGTFPENTILLVDDADNVTEGTLCYIVETGLFCLPNRELTDEEILQIIDFNNTRSYAIEQSSIAQEMREEQQEEQAQLRERLQEAGGISEEEAVEIAANQMKENLGPSADGKVETRVTLDDISEANDSYKGEIIYRVVFRNPEDFSSYLCTIDAMDGSVLDTGEVK